MDTNAYPAEYRIDAPEEIANWRPLVHWLLGIPHLIIANALSYAAQAVAIVSWFIILFTGKLPVGLGNFQCMVIRYAARAYSYVGFLREPYPAFEFSMTPADPANDPVKVDLQAVTEDRNRLSVGLRIIYAIPAIIVGAVLGIAAWVCYVIAFFAILFTGRWPSGLRAFVIRVARFYVRLQSYLYLLNDVWPPLSLDDPPPATPAPAA